MEIKEFSDGRKIPEESTTVSIPIVVPPTTSEIFSTKPPEYVPVVMDIYSPTRLDYFAARALQGLVTGRSEKDRRVAAKNAVSLAKELVELLP